MLKLTIEPMTGAPSLWQYTLTAPSGRQWLGQGYASEADARKAAAARERKIKVTNLV